MSTRAKIFFIDFIWGYESIYKITDLTPPEDGFVLGQIANVGSTPN